YSEEFQVMGDIDGRHSWIVGYYIEKQQFDLNYPPLFATFGNALSPTFSPTIGGGFSADQEDEQKGYFAQTTFDLSGWLLDGLKLTTGYRWTESSGTRGQIPVDQLALMSGNLVPGNTFQDRPGLDDSAP